MHSHRRLGKARFINFISVPSAAQLKLDLASKLHEAELIRAELAALGRAEEADPSSERTLPRLADHGQARQLLQTACADATTDQLKAAAKAAGLPDAYLDMISTCAATIPLAASFGYGCTNSQISAACPVTCKTCPTAPALPTWSPTFTDGTPLLTSGCLACVRHM